MNATSITVKQSMKALTRSFAYLQAYLNDAHQAPHRVSVLERAEEELDNSKALLALAKNELENPMSRNALRSETSANWALLETADDQHSMVKQNQYAALASAKLSQLHARKLHRKLRFAAMLILTALALTALAVVAVSVPYIH